MPAPTLPELALEFALLTQATLSEVRRDVSAAPVLRRMVEPSDSMDNLLNDGSVRRQTRVIDNRPTERVEPHHPPQCAAMARG